MQSSRLHGKGQGWSGVVLTLSVFFITFLLPSNGWTQPQGQEDSQTRAEAVEKITEEVIESQKKEAIKAQEGIGKKTIKERKASIQKERKPIVWTSPYATTEEVMLPVEVAALRRAFTPTDPFFHGGNVVEEQALFEEIARRDHEALYYAIEEFEKKPWWRGFLESLSAIAQYKQGLYSNYFNNRATDRLVTWNPLFGVRMKRWGVLSADLNYYGSFERLSFEPITIDPHVIKTHGGAGKLLYKPSKRFHFLASNDVRKTNKIVGVEGTGSNVSLGNNTVGNTVSTEFRYFLTQKDILNLKFNYDYSRTVSQDALRISRGYVPKISFLKMFGSRLILRAFYSFDYLKTTNPAGGTIDTAKFTSFRHEPGIGGTIVIRKPIVFDFDFSKQRLRFRGSDTPAKGNRINLKLSHQFTKRLSHSHILVYSDVEGKRSSISDVNSRDDAAFETFSITDQVSYLLTALTRLAVTWEYTRTDPNTPDAEANNRKKVTVELSRPIYRNRADLSVSWIFDKNTGGISGSYTAHSAFITLKMNYGAGRVK